MLVLHLGVRDGQLALWAETNPPAAPDASITPPALPFAADRKALAKALAAAGLAVKLTAKTASPAAVWLPTRAKQAVASTPLIAEPPSGRAKLALQPWQVPAWSLPVDAAVDLLAAVADRHTLAPGVIAGAELAWWAAVTRLAAGLVVRQQYLPGLVIDSEARAIWEPVIQGAAAEQAAALARAMPPVARALTAPDAAEAPSLPAESLLRAFVEQVVDHLVRSALPSDQHRPPVLHEAWLAALTRPNPVLGGDASELLKLERAIREWRAPLSALAASPFQLVVRLEEPPEEDDAWLLRFLLQPHADPSLLIELAEVWGDRESEALARYGRPGQYLLLALGQVAGLCPQLDETLHADPTAGVPLDTVGAFRFLTENAAALEQAGFRVLLPNWWKRRGAAGLTRRAKVRSAKHQGSGITLDSLVKFEWEVALGDEPVSLAELEQIAALKEPLVRLRGQWVQIDPKALEETLAALRRRESGEMSIRDVLALAAEPGTDGEHVSATGWMARLLREFSGQTEPETPPLPAGLRAELRPYQVRGYAWLSFLRRWGLGACLADDMGLGKTLQTLTLLQAAWEQGERRPALLVCPTSVVSNWRREAERFTPGLPLMVHHGLTRRRAEAFAAEAAQHALVVSSYGLLHRDLEFLKSVEWSAVILDEAQNVKNSETLQAKAARALPAGCRIALTGTPVENNVGDLWSLMAFLNPGLLGTAAQFRRRFFLPIQIERDPEAGAALRKLTGPFLLRRLKTDPTVITDLPEKQEMKVFCPLTKEQASLYAAVLQEAESALEDAEGIGRRGTVLATLLKLKQVCNHPAHFLGDGSDLDGRSGKLARVTEMLDEVLASGERALVFTQFAEMGELLVRHWQETFGQEVPFLHGGVPRGRRDALVERFQADADGPPIFVLSLKAGGTGLNLTRANHVFHFDRWWNPAVENQATDRAFRIGQTRNVQVHKLVCAGTLEESVDQLLDAKQAVAEQVVGTGEAWLTELSNAELHELLALRPEAVEG